MSQKIPIVISIDLEPDENITDPRNPLPWKGAEMAFQWAEKNRASIEEKTGAPAHFGWYLRVDPQIGKTYGSWDWGLKEFDSQIKLCADKGDEIGLHPHAYLWNNKTDQWMIAHGNWPYIQKIIQNSFKMFHDYYGKHCRSFRFGEKWMSAEAARELMKLGCRYDLTIEPGFPGMPTYHPELEHTGQLPDTREAPDYIYEVAEDNFLSHAGENSTGLWEIPVSTACIRQRYRKILMLRYALTDWEKLKPRTRKLTAWERPEVFRDVAEICLDRHERPYLHMGIRADIFSSPRVHKLWDGHIQYLLEHRRAKDFVFARPGEAMRLLDLAPNTQRA